MQVPNARVSTQEIMGESSGPICYNRNIHIEHLDTVLWSHNNSNVLEKSLWTCLSVSSVVAVFRIITIMNCSIIALVRCFTGKSHCLC